MQEDNNIYVLRIVLWHLYIQVNNFCANTNTVLSLAHTAQTNINSLLYEDLFCFFLHKVLIVQ